VAFLRKLIGTLEHATSAVADDISDFRRISPSQSEALVIEAESLPMLLEEGVVKEEDRRIQDE